MYNPFKQMSIPEYVVKRDHSDGQNSPDKLDEELQNKSFRASDCQQNILRQQSRSRSKSNASRRSGNADDLADLVISYQKSNNERDTSDKNLMTDFK